MLIQQFQILRRMLYLTAVENGGVQKPLMGIGAIHVRRQRENGGGAVDRKYDFFRHESAPYTPERIAVEEIEQQAASVIFRFRLRQRERRTGGNDLGQQLL